jgi:hypothetical protein
MERRVVARERCRPFHDVFFDDDAVVCGALERAIIGARWRTNPLLTALGASAQLCGCQSYQSSTEGDYCQEHFAVPNHDGRIKPLFNELSSTLE